MQNHIIRKLCWDVEFHEHKAESLIADQVAEFSESLMQSMNQLFDTLVPENKTVFIPSMEINIHPDSGNWNDKLTNEILDVLQSALLKNTMLETKDQQFTDDNSTYNDNLTVSPEDPCQQVSGHPNTSWQIFESFVKTGLIPWWSNKEARDLEKEVLHILRQQPQNIYFDNTGPDIQILNRLHKQFSKDFISETLQILKKHTKDPNVQEVSAWIDQLAQISGTPLISEKLNIAALVIHLVSPGTIKTHKKEYLKESLKFIFKDGEHLQKLLTYKPGVNNKPSVASKLSAVVLDILTEYYPTLNAKIERVDGNMESSKPISKDKDRSFSSREDKDSVPEAAKDEILPEKINKPDTEEFTNEAYKEVYTNNVGMVLLHPFIKTFFTELELLESNVHFSSVYHQQVAMHMLYYLATGKLKPFENDLYISKILCAWPLHESPEHDIHLTKDQILKADELLRAVLEHWKALKGTNISGLQETYLQRNGKINVQEDKTEIHVEQKSVDILLSKLPWGISHVIFPWCENPIYVYWT